MISFRQFKSYADNEIKNNKLKISFNENKLKNIYYPFRNDTDIFKWTSLFFNNTTKDNKIYLRDFQQKYIYDDNKKEFYLHRHAIFSSTYHINNIIRTKHLYIDGTFIVPKEFTQLLIVLYIYPINNIKIPDMYILVNNKKEESYDIIFNGIYNIITNNNKINLNLISITLDFEPGLINSIKKNFDKVRIVGCLFHYSQAIQRKLRNIGFFKKQYKSIANDLLKEIIYIPWLYNKNKNVLCEIQNKYL
jgi:hypothetical protein